MKGFSIPSRQLMTLNKQALEALKIFLYNMYRLYHSEIILNPTLFQRNNFIVSSRHGEFVS